MGELYECVLFTASLAKYADPVADLLDRWNVFRARLFRESCVFHRGNYVKDLNKLGRELEQIVIVDNSPASYIFHPDNAVSESFLINTFAAGLVMFKLEQYKCYASESLNAGDVKVEGYLTAENLLIL